MRVMPSEIAIHSKKLGKAYHVRGRERYRTLRESIVEIPRATVDRLVTAVGARHRSIGPLNQAKDRFWALRDVDFQVRRGEIVGVIGRNGAGKSTLLKILSRITEPTEGYAEVNGRVGSLLEVGTGFHPELSGRDNIYLSGAILGMRRAEIDRRFDEVVAFSGVEGFIDTPVKRYSSGMATRLGFAVAAHLDPEILVVDEVLAVGDLAFQRKCLGRMGDVAASGRTVLFVSHNMSAITSLCPVCLWLDGGRIRFFGPTSQAVAMYHDEIRAGTRVDLSNRMDRSGDGTVRATEFYVEDEHGQRCSTVRCGQSVRLVLEYEGEADSAIDRVLVNLIVVGGPRGEHLISCPSEMSGAPLRGLPASGRLVCTIPTLPLMPGHYDFHYSIRVGSRVADKVPFAASMVVTEGDFFGTGNCPVHAEHYGSVLVRHTWEFEPRA